MTGTIKKKLDTVIFEKLKEELVAGHLNPGQQISIDELAARYGVSRTPVIHATKMMAAEGIFTIRRNGRVEMPVFSPKQIQDICKMRVLLEDFAVKCICQEKSQQAIEPIRLIANECEQQAITHNNMIEARKKDLELHRQIVKSADNASLYSSYVSIQGQFMAANHLQASHTNAAQIISCEEHTSFIEELSRFHYRNAAKILEAHILSGCQKILYFMGHADQPSLTIS